MKNPLKLLFRVLVFTLPTFLLAQELPEVIPPSPSVASLMHFEEVPLDYYSGQPNIQIPIYSKSIGSGITVPITLRYSTLGLRVDERSGWVGTGWALDGEAVISRTVRGIADDANGYDSANFNYEYGVYHNGFFDIDFSQITSNLSDPTVQNFLWNTAGKGSIRHGELGDEKNGAYDKELDLYQVSLFGQSARFIIIKNSSNGLEVKMLSNDSNLKITLNYNSTTYTINSFEVLDTQGNKYLMAETETTTSHKGSATIFQDGNSNLNTSVVRDQITAWKVTEIKNSNDSLLATYFYQTINEEYDLPKSTVEHDIRSLSTSAHGTVAYDLFLCKPADPNCSDTYGHKAFNASVVKPLRSISSNYVEVSSKKVQRIEFRDNSSVHFTIGPNNHPEYINSGTYLSEILIKDNNNNRHKRFEFLYATTNHHSRLFLEEVKEYFETDNDLLTYTLDYKNKEQLPNSDLIANGQYHPSKDIWGYYKESPAPNSPIVYNLTNSADKTLVYTGVLTSIEYPTGGKKEYVFESNSFSSKGYGDFTEYEFKAYNPDNWDNQIASVRYDNFNNNSIVSTTFLVTEDQTVQFIPYFETGSYSSNINAILENIAVKLYEIDANGNIIHTADTFTFMESRVVFIPSGRYRMEYIDFNFNNSGNTPDIDIWGRLYYKNFSLIYDEIIYGGGIRLKSQIFRDSDDSIQRQINYFYDENEGELIPGSSRSTGVIDGYFTHIKDYIYSDSHLLKGSAGGGNDQNYTAYKTNINYNVREHLNSVYVSMTKGNYVGYSKVTRREFNNGRSVYEYTSPKDYPTHSSTSYGYPFLPVEDQSYKHGALLKEMIYDNASKPLKQTENSYQTVHVPQAKWLYTYDDTSCAWDQVYEKFSQYISHTPPNFPFGGDSSFYTNCVSRDNNNDPTNFKVPVFTRTQDYYFTKYLLNETLSKNFFYDDNNNQSEITTRQEYEYNPSNYQISKQHNYFTEANAEQHVETKYYYPVGISLNSNTAPIKSKLNNLNKVNEILETETFKNNIKLSETNNIYNEFLTNQVLPSSVKVGKGNDNPESRIVFEDYDRYHNPLEMSKIDGTKIIYVWGYDDTKPIAKIVGHSYQNISTSLMTVINEAKTASNPSGQYDEAILKTKLENLRNHSDLNDAQISTYTYNSMIGITSVTDARGYSMTYHYDDFNRLLYVKDKDGNILSENEYNYIN